MSEGNMKRYYREQVKRGKEDFTVLKIKIK
jgi:hypothetical protein